MTRSDISYQDKINELRLDISHPNSMGINFIFVEGSSDIRVFRKFFNLEKCKVENIPGGNPKLEECVDTLVPIYPLIVGIRDSDFIRIEGIEYKHDNIFLTDCHDIEMTILNHEPVVNSLLFEYSTLPVNKHIELKNDIIECISLLSCLKWLNFRETLELKFKSGFHDLISFENKSIDINEYVARVLSKSPNARITSERILIEKINDLKSTSPDALQLTNGHDLLDAFAKYFREIEGLKGISGTLMESSLRMIYDINAFSQTSLYTSLVEWQERNSTEIF